MAGPGTVFYKVLTGALAPRHFLDSTDIGTITVRYVVQADDEARTRLRVDAVFIEDGRRKAHLSDGSVETSESKAIQDKLQEIQLAEQKAAEELKSRQENAAAEAIAQRTRQERQEEAARLDTAQSSIRGLEQRLHDLQHQAELRVKESNTPLKSAPFQKAADLQSLGAYTELVVLIVTPYWYGVETTDGHRAGCATTKQKSFHEENIFPIASCRLAPGIAVGASSQLPRKIRDSSGDFRIQRRKWIRRYGNSGFDQGAPSDSRRICR